MNLSHVQPATLSERDRAALSKSLAESRLERLAGKLWRKAIDDEDFERARAIAAETDSWFEAEGE
ncbi:MAG TPA: hypothetical protein VMW15_08890 [Terracidiphilus sp.]|nr:hypothetical protein [Terracidiphilus sp.]